MLILHFQKTALAQQGANDENFVPRYMSYESYVYSPVATYSHINLRQIILFTSQKSTESCTPFQKLVIGQVIISHKLDRSH